MFEFNIDEFNSQNNQITIYFETFPKITLKEFSQVLHEHSFFQDKEWTVDYGGFLGDTHKSKKYQTKEIGFVFNFWISKKTAFNYSAYHKAVDEINDQIDRKFPERVKEMQKQIDKYAKTTEN